VSVARQAGCPHAKANEVVTAVYPLLPSAARGAAGTYVVQVAASLAAQRVSSCGRPATLALATLARLGTLAGPGTPSVPRRRRTARTPERRAAEQNQGVQCRTWSRDAAKPQPRRQQARRATRPTDQCDKCAWRDAEKRSQVAGRVESRRVDMHTPSRGHLPERVRDDAARLLETVDHLHVIVGVHEHRVQMPMHASEDRHHDHQRGAAKAVKPVRGAGFVPFRIDRGISCFSRRRADT